MADRGTARTSPRALGFAAMMLAAACSDAPSPWPEGDPGRVTARRLNRSEYDHTVAELLGTALQPARAFPADDRAFGFDNVGDALRLSSTHVELLEQATWALLDDAFARRDAGEADVRARVFVCSPDPDAPHGCVRRILEHFVPRAFRRPASAAQIDRTMADFERARERGASVDEALATALATVMLAPEFLFRIERGDDDDARPLDDWELASRLSYFLWSSMPDAASFDAAARGELRSEAGIAAEARRMLADPRAQALVEDFAGQWLAIRGLDDLLKDAHRFPDFDDALAASMAAELEASFADLIANHRPIQQLLVTPRSFVDARVAEHYGLDAVTTTTPVGIHWGSLPRGGLLLSAGWLAVQAYPFTTSPARRGRFVLEQLLCQAVGSPPPGIVMSAPSTQAGKHDESDARRADPACAGCHARIDPIGLAFERYDATGRWRSSEDGEPIADAGTLPDGRSFADARGLTQLIADDPAFPRCAVTQTLRYALGRGLGPSDVTWIDAIDEAFEAHGFDTAELFVLVARSPAFRRRGGLEP